MGAASTVCCAFFHEDTIKDLTFVSFSSLLHYYISSHSRIGNVLPSGRIL